MSYDKLILLDTYILLRAAADELPPEASYYIKDRANTLLFSPASIWNDEIHGPLITMADKAEDLVYLKYLKGLSDMRGFNALMIIQFLDKRLERLF